MCTQISNFILYDIYIYIYMIGPKYINRLLVRLQMSLLTIRGSDQTAEKIIHKVLSSINLYYNYGVFVIHK